MVNHQSMMIPINIPSFQAASLTVAIVIVAIILLPLTSCVWYHTHALPKLIFPCFKLKQLFEVLSSVRQTGVAA